MCNFCSTCVGRSVVFCNCSMFKSNRFSSLIGIVSFQPHRRHARTMSNVSSKSSRSRSMSHGSGSDVSDEVK